MPPKRDLRENSPGVIVHGANASTPRPPNQAVVIWIGSANPANKTPSDVWINPEGGQYVTQATFDAQGPSGRLLTEASSTVYQGGMASGTTYDLDGLSITFTVASRPVLVWAYLPWVSATAVAGFFAQLVDLSANQFAISGASISGAGIPASVVLQERITAAGTYTRKVQATRFGGTGTVSNNFNPASNAVVSRIMAVEQ